MLCDSRNLLAIWLELAVRICYGRRYVHLRRSVLAVVLPWGREHFRLL